MKKIIFILFFLLLNMAVFGQNTVQITPVYRAGTPFQNPLDSIFINWTGKPDGYSSLYTGQYLRNYFSLRKDTVKSQNYTQKVMDSLLAGLKPFTGEAIFNKGAKFGTAQYSRVNGNGIYTFKTDSSTALFNSDSLYIHFADSASLLITKNKFNQLAINGDSSLTAHWSYDYGYLGSQHGDTNWSIQIHPLYGTNFIGNTDSTAYDFGALPDQLAYDGGDNYGNASHLIFSRDSMDFEIWAGGDSVHYPNIIAGYHLHLSDNYLYDSDDNRYAKIKDVPGGGTGSLATLTPGYGLSGSVYNGNTAYTWKADTSAIATLAHYNGVIPTWATDHTVSSFNSRTGAVTLSKSDVTAALGLTGSKPVFTDASGNPTTTALGASNQFIKADGSLDGTSYAATSSLTAYVQLSHIITRETPTGTQNGTNVTFSLAHTPLSGTESVFVNGLLQGYTDDYTISGNQITFTLAPLSGDKIRVNYIY